ncbi:MAG: hypothetical protein RJQ04_10275 [Longimicrobiales bacterium]
MGLIPDRGTPPALRATAGAWIAAVAAVLALGPASAAGGQEPPAGTVRSARVVADLTAGDGSADVTVEYRIGGVARGDTLPGRVLAFGDSRISDLTVGGRPVPLAAGSGVASTASVVVSSRTGSGDAVVILRYVVAEAAARSGPARRFQVPVLTLDRPPEASQPGLFVAEFRVPRGWSVMEGFPTTLAGDPDRPGVYVATLPVVPSVLGLRARTDGVWRPGLPTLFDGLALLVLIGFFWAAWRHIRTAP